MCSPSNSFAKHLCSFCRVCTLHQRLLELQRRHRSQATDLSSVSRSRNDALMTASFTKSLIISSSGRGVPLSSSSKLTNGGRAGGGSCATQLPEGVFRQLVERNQSFSSLQASLDWVQQQSSSIQTLPYGSNWKCKLHFRMKMSPPFTL